MYKISEFANLMGVSTKTLRLYDEKGILKPFYVDEITGYRYYGPAQINQLTAILELKSIGLTLEEIRMFQQKEYSLDDELKMLEEKRNTIDKMIANITFQKQKNTNYSAYIKTDLPMYVYQYNCHAKDVKEMIQKYALIVPILLKNNIQISYPAYSFIEFTNEEIGMEDLDCQMFVQVKKNESKNNLVKYRDEVTYVATIHSDDYINVLNAYDFLYSYIKINNYEICGYPSERYINAPFVNTETKFITEIRIPIKKPK